jgi:hypothetical protein
LKLKLALHSAMSMCFDLFIDDTWMKMKREKPAT